MTSARTVTPHIEAVIENIDWLLAAHESAWHITHRLGLAPSTITRYAYVCHRDDLIEVFGALRTRNEKSTCERCGGECSKKAHFCLRCSQSLRNYHPTTKFGKPRKEAAA